MKSFVEWSDGPNLPEGLERRVTEGVRSERVEEVTGGRSEKRMALCGRGTMTAIRRALIFQNTFSPPISLHRHFCSKSKKPLDTKLNFSLPSDSDDDQDSNTHKTKRPMPPPYDPFSKKPAIQEPKNPKDLQEIFHNMRNGDGLFNHAVKMFDALSKEGLTHEALELLGQIKDKGHMPDVVAHTAILEAYANVGQPKEALKVYMRMLASGVSPNAYTYAVLVKGLASDGKYAKEASKYMLEMMDKGMRPNAETYTSLFERLVREERLDEAARLLEQMKEKGFVPDHKAVREALSAKRGPVFRILINLLFGS